MNTRQQVRDLCRRRLSEMSVPYRWSDLQINQWINDAIADYNVHFPRRDRALLATVAGQNRYRLAGMRRLLTVEYPLAAVPPDLQNPLRRMDHTLPEFWALAGYYDVLSSPAGSDELELWLSGVVSGCPPGQDGDCRCTGHFDHDYLDDDADPISLPDRHLELVMLYVRWAAAQEVSSRASADPDPTSLAAGTLELNTNRAQRLYLNALGEIRRLESESCTTAWKMDAWDQIY